MANTAETDTNMSDLTPLTPIIERGLSLHKLIRYGLRINVTDTHSCPSVYLSIHLGEKVI